MDDLLARGSEKWTKYPPDVLPAWIAEMDFALASPVRDALVRAVELGDLGYIGNVDGLHERVPDRRSQREVHLRDPRRQHIRRVLRPLVAAAG